MLNKVILQGRLAADPDLRHTGNGTAVTTFRLAVERDYKNQSTGERGADFINVAVWRGTAELVAKYLAKGRMALVDGRMQVREYTDKDGNRRYVTEVVASSIYFCDSKRNNTPASGPDEFKELDEDDGELPF